MSPPSLGIKSKTGKKEGARSKLTYCLLHAVLLLGLLSSPDHGIDMFLRNVGSLSAGYSMLYFRRCTNVNAVAFEILTAVDTESKGLDTKSTELDTKSTGVDKKSAAVDMKNTGVDMKSTGVDMKNTGVETESTGVDNKSAAVDMKNTGVETESIGVDKKSTGVQKNAVFPGCDALGFWQTPQGDIRRD
jgi:hypothetical protein